MKTEFEDRVGACIVVACLVAVMLSTGCAQLIKLGVTEDLVATGVQVVLARQGLAGVMSDAQVREIITIVRAHERLQAIGNEVGQDARLQARIEELLARYVADGAIVLPSPVTEPATVDPAAHITRQITQWYGGVNLSSAFVDSRYKLEISRDGRVWSAAPADWPLKDGSLQTIVCAAYRRPDGSWVGGKYDWNWASPSPRSWKNIKDGYGGWIAPPAGTEMRVWAASVNGRSVSTETVAVFE